MTRSNGNHTPLPWRIEQDTDLIWGACDQNNETTYGMGYPISVGFSSFGQWANGRPDFIEREANAAFIVRACNSHYELLDALKLFVRAEEMARDGAPPHDADKLIEIGKAAISKAEGRS